MCDKDLDLLDQLTAAYRAYYYADGATERERAGMAIEEAERAVAEAASVET